MFSVLTRFRVFLSDVSSKTLQKKVLQKNRVETFLQKIDKNPKLHFSQFFLSRFWAFLGKGVQKHDKKISTKTDQLCCMWR
jgi:hypothetical protein